ncbi:MAG: glycosyltransferase family 4 protein [bacterium]
MKLLIFSFEFPPVIYGGLGTYALETTRKYVEFGHDVCVVAPNIGGDLPEKANWNGVEVRRPRSPEWGPALALFVDREFRAWGDWLSYLGDVLSYNLLGASGMAVGGQEFDVVIGHDWLGVVGAVLAGRALGAPIVFHLHSTEGGRQGGGGSEGIKFMESQGIREADLAITVSHTMREEIKRMGVPEDRVEVVWNGVDEAKYDPGRFSAEETGRLRDRYDVEDDEKMVLFIGRLTKVKGVVPLARAVPHVLAQHPNVKFVFLGKGELEQEVREVLRYEGVEGRVALRTEFVPEEERILHYAACDLAVFPSLYEPFGIVSLEAMAMEKPVVVGARGTSGFREQVINSGEKMCGAHVNPNDPADIAWGINLLLDGDLEAMGRNARQRVLEEFTWDIIASRTLNIYESVIRRKRGA